MTAPLVLTLSCADRPGITARVTTFLYERGGNILDAQQFNDRESDAFFMRVEFVPGDADRGALREAFTPLAREYGMEWKLALRDRPRRVLIMVSKFDHCLADLLYRWRIGELPIDPVAIISNHPRDAIAHTAIGDVPFHHLPLTRDTKAQQEAQVRQIALFVKDLEEFSDDCVWWAIREWRRNETRRPTPASLRQLCMMRRHEALKAAPRPEGDRAT